MHSCVFLLLSVRKQEYYLSFSATLTTLKVMTSVALKHGAVLGQSGYFLEMGSADGF